MALHSTLATGSSSERGSRVGEVYLNRAGPHGLSPLVHSAPLSFSGWRREGFHSLQFRPFTLTVPCARSGRGWQGGMQRRPYNGQRETSLLLGTQKEMVTENRKHRDTFTDTHRNKNTDILKYDQHPAPAKKGQKARLRDNPDKHKHKLHKTPQP